MKPNFRRMVSLCVPRCSFSTVVVSRCRFETDGCHCSLLRSFVHLSVRPFGLSIYPSAFLLACSFDCSLVTIRRSLLQHRISQPASQPVNQPVSHSAGGSVNDKSSVVSERKERTQKPPSQRDHDKSTCQLDTSRFFYHTSSLLSPRSASSFTVAVSALSAVQITKVISLWLPFIHSSIQCLRYVRATIAGQGRSVTLLLLLLSLLSATGR